MPKSSWAMLVIVALLAWALVACGEDGLGPRRTPTTASTPSTPTPMPLPADASTVARIRARGHLLVGVRYDDEPFGTVNAQGDLIGFDVDLAREFAARWLGDRESLRFVQVTNSSVSDRVKTGLVDLVIGALTPGQGVARDLNFSAAYYHDGLALIVRTDRPITDTLVVNGPSDLGGLLVGVVEEAETETPLLRAAGGANPKVVYYPGYFSALSGLETDVVDAVVGPRRTLQRLAAGRTGLGLTPRFTRDVYAIGVPKDDGAFLDLVNVTLMDIMDDGMYARLFQRWLPDETAPVLETWPGTSRLTFNGASDTSALAPATIQEIEARGHLAVGILNNQLPFGDFDADEVARGFEAELVRVLAARWLGDADAVQFLRHTEESGISALQTGQIDLLATHLPHTLRGDDEIDFSQTIYQDGIGLLVSSASGIDAFAALNGTSVAVPRDGVTAELFQRAAARQGLAVSVQTVESVDGALAGVAEGRYRAYADLRSELLILAYANPGFLVLDERLTERPVALGLRQNDAPFRDLVNLTLQELAVDGSFATVYSGWFGTDRPYALDIWPGAPYRSLRLSPRPVVAP